jgi:hypothetical protein
MLQDEELNNQNRVYKESPKMTDFNFESFQIHQLFSDYPGSPF